MAVEKNPSDMIPQEAAPNAVPGYSWEFPQQGQTEQEFEEQDAQRHHQPGREQLGGKVGDLSFVDRLFEILKMLAEVSFVVTLIGLATAHACDLRSEQGLFWDS